MKYDIITIGTATRDIFITSPYFKIVKDKKHLKKLGFISGEATCFALGAKIEVDAPIFTTGGGASNTAITFARQGFKTSAFIKIGNDRTGQLIKEELENENITTITAVDKNLTTDTGIILLSPNGERTILINRGASKNLTEKEIPLKNLNAKWVYIAPGKMPFNLIKKIVDHFARNKTNIVLSPSKNLIEAGLKKLSPIIKNTKVFILNREEASYLTGIDYDKKEQIFKKLDNVIGGLLLMTDGKNGGFVSDNQLIYEFKLFPGNKVVDETGAGDAFGSGFISGLMNKNELCSKGLCNKNNIEYAIRLASANSKSVVEHIGAKKGIITRRQFKSNMRWKKLPIKIHKI
ncbi:hypothetical protein COV23_01375 [Candidatus Wolfebacteria bacterium CG10_big_fil_rev_8_21_14_0_10_31_9]|uniref:Carbohydrate kinase PfkB domain-containing protein n=1 Tax=Candidatus Wolfebacteria bacterium CG10_big_fil_rev_8_21_14_0_10_31_9 TaxID=1975070 RepID=A0A2H0RCI3_9BACT|nr:MAG: hypothetical protein COV23_01375 [Candidatus Wolfebacteria bacterium CG10_big_fil_rev_8_21_14_0_10_31_9]